MKNFLTHIKRTWIAALLIGVVSVFAGSVYLPSLVFGQGSGTIGTIPNKVKISGADTTTGYLENKLVAGTNITLTKNNTGANETITISASGGGGGGTPCTTTALSIQYNAAGSFGCVSKVTSDGTNLSLVSINALFVDSVDTTKKFRFVTSSIGTGITRDITVPNVSGTLITTGNLRHHYSRNY